MAVHIDVLARISERRLRQETDKLADSLDTAGLMAGRKYGGSMIDGMAGEIAGRSPKVQRALNSVAAAGQGVVDANRKLSVSNEEVARSQENITRSTERTEAARRSEQSAIENVTIAERKLTEAKYNTAQASKSLAADSEKLAIIREREATAEDRLEQAKRASIAASERVQDAVRAETTAVDAHVDAQRRQVKTSEDLTKARRREADAHRSAAEAVRSYAKDSKQDIRGLEAMGESIQEIGTAAMKTGRGLGTLASGPIVLMMVDLAKRVVTASQAIALLPAVAVAAGAGVNTLQLATMGFSDTLDQVRDPEKFAEEIQKLSPAAQQAALSIRDLVNGPLGQLQQLAQETFFDGIAEEIEGLTGTYLPSVQEMTKSIAGSFNDMIMGVGDVLMLPSNQSTIDVALQNISTAFDNLVPAASSLGQAFIDLFGAGADFLPDLASGAADAAAEFASFIREARDSGELKTWIRQGIDAAVDLAGSIKDIGVVIYEVFGSDESVEGFRNDLEGVLAVVKLLNGDFSQIGESWREELDGMAGMAGFFRDALNNWQASFDMVKLGAVDLANTVKDAFINGPIAVINNLIEKFNSLPAILRPAGATIPLVPNVPSIPLPLPEAKEWKNWKTADQEAYEKTTNRPGVGAIGGAMMGLESPEAFAGNYQRKTVPDAPTNGKNPFNAPADQWSLDSIPIGQFGNGVPALPGMPAMQGANGPQSPGSPGFGKFGSYTVDPMAVWEAELALMDQRATVEEARQRLLEVMADNNASELERMRARNDVAKAEGDYLKDQAKLMEAQQGKFKEFSSSMSDMGAQLDADFGISKGLSGIAENFVKFVGQVAAAPKMAEWQAQMDMDPTKGGFGLLGIRGAQNMDQGLSPVLGNPQGQGLGGVFGMPVVNAQQGSYATMMQQYGMTGVPMMPYGNIPAPSILEDTGSVPSGPQSRNAAAIIEQVFGSELRGKIGGSRDSNTAKGTHDAGLSIDIPIGPDQKDLGDRINAFLQQHADQLGLKYSIWENQGRYPSDPSKVAFNSPGHFNHIDAHFDGQGVPGGAAAGGPGPNMPMQWGDKTSGGGGGSLPGLGPVPNALAMPFGTPGGSTFAPPGQFNGAMGGANAAAATGPKAIARMIYQQAMSRGYSSHAAQAIVAYALGESSLNPGISGGVQGAGGGGGNAADDEVLGLFQQKAAFARGGGIDPSQRTDPVANTYAYLNQLEKNRHLPIEQALPATSVGGPLASGAGSAPQKWGPLMKQAGELIGATPGGTGGGGGGFGGIPFPQSFGGPGGVGLGPVPGLPPTTPFSGGVAAPGLGTAAAPGLGVDVMAPPGVGAGVGAGMNNNVMSPVGGLEPYSNPGGGNFGVSSSLMGMASTAASAIPGIGQAAATGMQLTNRAIQFAGQAAGIGIDGLMQTFLPTGGSALAQQNWFTKIVGGLAGASPAVPNTAGDKPPAPLTPMQVAQQNALNAASNVNGGNTMNVEINNSRDTGDGLVRDLEYHTGMKNGESSFAGGR